MLRLTASLLGLETLYVIQPYDIWRLLVDCSMGVRKSFAGQVKQINCTEAMGSTH